MSLADVMAEEQYRYAVSVTIQYLNGKRLVELVYLGGTVKRNECERFSSDCASLLKTYADSTAA